jgi:hypothetical protein
MIISIGRSQPLYCLAVVCCTCFSFASPAAAPVGTPKAKGGTLELRVRDAATGYAIPGAMVIDFGSSGSALRSYRLPQSANLRTEVAHGAHQLEISAPGHRPLRTQVQVSPEQSMPITIWLDPLDVAVGAPGRTPAAPAIPGLAVIQGFVVDAELGVPLSGAQVLVGEAATQTDGRGFFTLSLPVPIARPESVPEQASLRVDSDGHETYVLSNMPLVEGESDLLIELHRGSGIRIKDGTHKLLRSPEEMERSQSAPAAPESEEAGGGPNDALLVIAPPSSIRVGYNCSCTSCSTVEVMSLETYVKRGLPREWFASWSPHSLRAGAIAYRSYGAYYVEHPLRLDYDICNTACCQVNGTTTSPSTNSAADLTSGILLQRAGAVFRAEYSAENNNFGCGQPGCSNASCICGNGNAGSPGASWPCVAEPWDSGRACSGHGRGMCQWGTQDAAAQGQLWNWIEDHYYNNNGVPGGLRSAYMTSPLDVAWFAPDPATVSAGDFFTIYISAVNYAEAAHTEVMLGASLYSDATGYISDPSNDVKVTLYPGSNDVSRGFNVPPWAPSATYDLIVALWLDVDGDSAITPVDQPLVLYVLPAALTVR